MAFTFADVAFGICRTVDINHFSALVGDAFPFVDPVGSATHLQQVKAHLRTFPHLSNIK
ncbi:MAG: hypothetical protein AABZ31_10435 [Bdellovibrionota bacterium]